MSHPKPVLEEIINDLKIQAETILKENKKYLDELRKELKEKGDTSQEMLLLLEGRFWEYRKNGPFKALTQVEKVHSACAIIGLIEELNLKEISHDEQLVSIFLLGRACGELEKHNPQIFPTKLYRDFFHSKKSKISADQRWEERDKKLKEPLEKADKLWADGSKLLHYEMAEYLNGEYPEFSYEVLKEHLKPIAKEYDRLFGLKGVTKNQ
jgi:hypothetical protein